MLKNAVVLHLCKNPKCVSHNSSAENFERPRYRTVRAQCDRIGRRNAQGGKYSKYACRKCGQEVIVPQSN